MLPPRETETDEARACLRLLCEVLDKWLQPKIKLYSTPDSSLSVVSFDDLWYVFKPGAEVRTTGRGQIQLCVEFLDCMSCYCPTLTFPETPNPQSDRRPRGACWIVGSSKQPCLRQA